MAAPIHGSMGAFDRNQEDWLSYTERLEQYFAANGIKDDEADKRRAILLSFCGAETFRLIKSLLAPVKPETKTFEDIVALVEKHHNPEPSATVQRYKFHSRCRQPEETVSQYVAELRRIAEKCQFGDNLESALCDRLVCGIQDSRIQRRLLGEPALTFRQAFNLAQSLESADRDAKTLQSPPIRVNAVNTSRNPQNSRNYRKPDRPCYRCGGQHLEKDCRFKDAECRKCKKKGHIARACRSKPPNQPAFQKPQSRQPRRQQTNLLTDDFPEDAAETDPVYSLFTVSHRSAKPLRVDVELNQTPLSMEVDTGASVSVISRDTYKKLWPSAQAPPLKNSNVQLQTYTGESLAILGTIHVEVHCNNQTATLPLVVVKGRGPSLLGRDWLQYITLDWKTLNTVTQSTNNPTLSAVLAHHKAVFNDELRVIRGTSAKLYVDPQTRPRFFKPRAVPYSMRGKVEQELDRLQKQGIIKPVAFSDWAAPIVPVLKKDGSVRICGDYRLTVNQAAKLETYPLPKIEDLLTSLTGGKTFTKLDLAHAYQQVELEEDSRKFVTINTLKGLFEYTRLPLGIWGIISPHTVPENNGESSPGTKTCLCLS